MCCDRKEEEEDGTGVLLRRLVDGTLVDRTLEVASLSRISAVAEEEWRTVGDEMQYTLAPSHSYTSKQTHINTLVSSAKSITNPPSPPNAPKQQGNYSI